MSAQEHMPPPTLKRARPHSTNPSSSSATPTAAQPTASSALPGPHTTSRAKRRKPEPASVEKEREKETEGEVKTKVSGAALQAMSGTAWHLFFPVFVIVDCFDVSKTDVSM